jgi:hypothetical protein
MTTPRSAEALCFKDVRSSGTAIETRSTDKPDTMELSISWKLFPELVDTILRDQSGIVKFVPRKRSV